MATEKKDKRTPRNRKIDAQPVRRQFLRLRDRDDLIWWFDFAEAELAAVRSSSNPELFKREFKQPVRTLTHIEIEQAVVAADDGAEQPLPHRDRRRVRLVGRARRIEAAFAYMRAHGVGSWLNVLAEGYSRNSVILEDEGEFVPLEAGESYDPKDPAIAVFGEVVLKQVKKPKPSSRRRHGQREERHLSNGAVVLRGGHVVGQEDAVRSVLVPGLERMAHPTARRNLEEALELACRAYEAARGATDSKYRVAKPVTVESITPAEAARRLGVTRQAVGKMMSRGVFRLQSRAGKLLVEWPPLVPQGRGSSTKRARSSAL